MDSTLLLAERGATKRKVERKNVFSHSEHENMRGTLKIKDRNSGAYTMGVKNRGESVRVFPLSNWTELDVWLYIFRENIPIVPLYFAKERPVVERDGSIIMVDDERMRLLPNETIQTKKVRFRTLGCYPLTGAVESEAVDLESILLELMESRMSERTGRVIDSDSSSSMEKKKRHGYF